MKTVQLPKLLLKPTAIEYYLPKMVSGTIVMEKLLTLQTVQESYWKIYMVLSHNMNFLQSLFLRELHTYSIVKGNSQLLSTEVYGVCKLEEGKKAILVYFSH